MAASDTSAGGESDDEDDDVEIDDEDDGDDEEFLEALGEEASLDDDLGPGVSAGEVPWAQKALEVAERVVGGTPDLELFVFHANPASKRLDIRLDKLTDRYGSPSLEEIGDFSRSFNAALEEALGAEAAGEIEVEVSSPGAEREVRVPHDLLRFAELPMRVEYDTGAGGTEAKVLRLVRVVPEADAVEWALADVRANRAGKGRPLNKKQREEVLAIALPGLRRVNLHVDI